MQKPFNLCGILSTSGSAIFMSQMDGKFMPVLLNQETILLAKHIRYPGILLSTNASILFFSNSYFAAVRVAVTGYTHLNETIICKLSSV